MFINVSLILMIFMFFMMFSGLLNESILLDFEFSFLPLYNFSTSFFIDSLGFKFLVTVFIISSTVFFYSLSYMDDESNKSRFVYILVLFVASMAVLIIGGSAPLLVLGWDGLGLSSYFLIVYYQSFKHSGSGLITVISNRIGDIFIIVASVIIFSEMTSWFFLSSFLSFENFWLLSIILLLGAITKSAMFPYCTWLPEAMAAPTPVSSLVHSSTLVTAGVYLLLRAFFWLPVSVLLVIGALGSFTLLLSSMSALFCLDFKKIIALSTLSQLGFMITTLSINLPEIAFFHLLTHALFKSSLFMSAGSYIHLGKANQDMRLMDPSYSPSSSFILIAIPILALSGFLFTAGFYSKESILMTSFSFNLNLFLSMSMILGALLTMMYSMRMLLSLSTSNLISNIFPESSFMDISKIFLMILSVIGGWVLFFNSSPSTSNASILSSIILSLFFIASFIWLSSSIIFKPESAIYWNQFNYLARITNTTTPSSQNKISNFMIMNWESGWQEMMGPKIILFSFSDALKKLYSMKSLSANLLLTIILFSSVSSLLIL